MLVPTDQDLAKELASMPGQEEGLRLIQTYFLNCGPSSASHLWHSEAQV